METPSGVFCNDLPRKADIGVTKTSFLVFWADFLNAHVLPIKDDVDAKADMIKSWS